MSFRSIGEIVASVIDALSGAGDVASNPAMARAGYDLPRNLSAVCVSRAAFAHGKDKSNV